MTLKNVSQKLEERRDFSKLSETNVLVGQKSLYQTRLEAVIDAECCAPFMSHALRSRIFHIVYRPFNSKLGCLISEKSFHQRSTRSRTSSRHPTPRTFINRSLGSSSTGPRHFSSDIALNMAPRKIIIDTVSDSYPDYWATKELLD